MQIEMEAQANRQTQTENQQHQHKSTLKKSSSRNSDLSSTHMDSPHSPLRSRSHSHSPMPSEYSDPHDTLPNESPENSPGKPPDNSMAMVALDKFTQYSPLTSPTNGQKPPESASKNRNALAADSQTPRVVLNRAMREEPPPSVSKVGPVGSGDGRRSGTVASIVKRSKREVMLKRAALGFRLSEFALCLISFAVMAADKTQGWSGDSFDRYKEYRYCLSINVMAFVYSSFQAYDLTCHLVTGNYVIRHYLRPHFVFFMDQVLAYLLISSSSSAATRVDDWQSNWGKDKFTEMATASVSMSFLAFAAFAISSLLSGYNLCNP